ncbi:4'-phosphopantetheinyl transferase superfamily protein [Flavobacteriales bacterium]|nr:4'-phosphopantetheinyl transferase superfamily protein [Flavobacteriales bacterium]
MGIIKKYTENNCQIAIWDLNESLAELLKLGARFDSSKFKAEKRKKDFLVSRLLLNELEPNQQISYNSNGAPEISNGKHISISHSKNLVAIIISDKKVGLDIEYISEKPLRLSPKFITESSQQDLTKEKATLIWCCKEAVFKWHQKGGVNFIKDIIIPEFTVKKIITIQFKNKELNLNYKKINNHYLVYVCK